MLCDFPAVRCFVGTNRSRSHSFTLASRVRISNLGLRGVWAVRNGKKRDTEVTLAFLPTNKRISHTPRQTKHTLSLRLIFAFASVLVHSFLRPTSTPWRTKRFFSTQSSMKAATSLSEVHIAASAHRHTQTSETEGETDGETDGQTEGHREADAKTQRTRERHKKEGKPAIHFAGSAGLGSGTTIRRSRPRGAPAHMHTDTYSE